MVVSLVSLGGHGILGGIFLLFFAAPSPILLSSRPVSLLLFLCKGDTDDDVAVAVGTFAVFFFRLLVFRVPFPTAWFLRSITIQIWNSSHNSTAFPKL